MNAPTGKFIDLQKVLREKNPRLAAWLPRFALNAVRRLIHEDEVNAFIAEHGHKKGIAFAEAILHNFQIRVETEGLDRIPAQGGFILAANHPLGGLDAMTLFSVLAPKRRDMKFVVNDILLQLGNLNELFIGVNKHGRNAQENLQAIDRLYASDQAVLIFPAGLVSRKRRGRICDLEWKKSFVTRARKHGRPVIPVHISGRLTNRFYRLANLRSAFRIRANLEMLWLVDEMFRQRGHTIRVTVREPIPAATFDRSRTDGEWAAYVRAKVYGDGVDELMG